MIIEDDYYKKNFNKFSTAVEQLGLNARTLQRERSLGMVIPYVKIGKRVRYKREDVEKHIERHTVGNHQYD
mgnify:CR=1 FL=1